MAFKDPESFPLRVYRFFRSVFDFLAYMIYALFFERMHNKKPDLPPIHDKLLLYPASVLAGMICRKEVKSEDVVRAYISRIKDANGKLNFLVDLREKDALRDAKEVDQLISRSTHEELRALAANKPLLGVPFTTKDNISVAGMLLTGGLYSRAQKKVKAERDAEAIRRMREAGAIPLATTNVPELGMSFETYSVKFGRTLNPYHLGRIAGGSSGGEGSAIGSGASVIGVGSDVGGSIRIPAFFNGIFGLKPTEGTCSNEGSYPPPSEGPVGTKYLLTGPMCRYAGDLLPMLKVLTNPQDAATMRLSYPLPSVKRIKVYFMPEIQGTVLESPVHDCLKVAQYRLAKELESKAGITVERVNMSEAFKDSFRMWDVMMSSDRTQKPFKKLLGGDGPEVNPWLELAKWAVGFGYGPWTRHTFAGIAFALVQEVTGKFLDKKPEEKAEVEEALNNLRTELDAKLGDDGVLLFQSHPTPAPYHGMPCLPNAFNFSYTAIFNVLGNPVLQVPLGMSHWRVPLGTQLVASRHKEANLIALALTIEKLMGGWIPPCVVNTRACIGAEEEALESTD